MRLFTAKLVLAVSLLTTTFVAGCAANEVDDSEEASDAVRSAGPIKLSNWESHPTLKKIFDLRAETDISANEGVWDLAKKENLCEGPGEESRMKVTDEDGRIRSLSVRWGSEDQSSTLRAIYDTKKKLRLVESTSRSVRGDGEDHLVFFDTKGKVVWEVIREWRSDPGLEAAGAWRTPKPIEEDEFDTFTFDDPHFIDAPASVFDREPTCG